jgi:hypothetical protein
MTMWQRYPARDKRFAWGDDWAGDAWMHYPSKTLHWCAVGCGPPDWGMQPDGHGGWSQVPC